MDTLTAEPSVAGRPLRADLRASVGDAMGHSLMVGAGETYFAAFALALGMHEVVAGLVATAPLLIGAVLQLVTPWAIARIGTHRRWAYFCAGLQALAFLPLAAFAWRGEMHPAVLYLIVAIYWGTGQATGPAWNVWMGRIVPANIRARYFSYRTRLAQGTLLAGFLIGGVGLHAASHADLVLVAFAALFGLAALGRGFSTACLFRQSEPVGAPPREVRVGLRDFARRARHAGDGRLLVYLLAMQAAVQISGPFFTPYMLRQVSFSYAEYVALVSIAYVGKVLALAPLGRFAQRYGTPRLLFVGGLGICPLAAMWLVSSNFYWLLGVQLVGGAFWAGYELAMCLLWFESVAEHERTSMQTTFNLAHASATCLGSLLGGALLLWLGKHPESYLVVFATSSLLRVAAIPLLVRIPQAAVQRDVVLARLVASVPRWALRAPLQARLATRETDWLRGASEAIPLESASQPLPSRALASGPMRAAREETHAAA